LPNTFLTADAVAREATFRLRNNLVFANLMFRGHEVEWSTPPKKGSAVRVRQPASFTATDFSSTYTTVDHTETSVSLTLEERPHIKVALTATELTYDLETFSEQIVQPAMESIADYIDVYAASLYDEVYTTVGTATDPPDSVADIIALGTEADNSKWPVDNRIAVIDPTAKGDFLANVTHMLDASQSGDGGERFRNASMGSAFGWDWFMNQNIQTHTAGTASGSTTDATGYAIGLKTVTLAVAGTGSILVGDVISFNGVAGQYVITSGDADVSGGGTISFEPGLEQAIPAGATAITLVATHVANLCFNPRAFSLAVVAPPASMGAASAVSSFEGLGVRVTFDFDNTTGSDYAIFETLVGGKCVQPELALRNLG